MRRSALTVLIAFGVLCAVAQAWYSNIGQYSFPTGFPTPILRPFDVSSRFDPSKAQLMFIWSEYQKNLSTGEVVSTARMLFDEQGITLNKLARGQVYTIASVADDSDWDDFVTMLTVGSELPWPPSDENTGYLGVGQIGFMQLDAPYPGYGTVSGQFYGDFYALDAADMTGDFGGNFSRLFGPYTFRPGSQAGYQITRITLRINEYSYNRLLGKVRLSYTVALYGENGTELTRLDSSSPGVVLPQGLLGTAR